MNKQNLQKAMDARLSGLRLSSAAVENVHRHMEGEKTVKRKLSLALVLIILLLAAAGAAIALTGTDLLSYLFSGSQQVPSELLSAVSRPDAMIENADIKITLNEYLYDGEKFFVHWSMDNLSGKQIMVTMTPFKVKDKRLLVESHTFIQAFRHELGYILGGNVEKVEMPDHMDNYATYVSPQEDCDKRMYHALTRGATLEITSSITVWEVLNTPVLMDPQNYDYFSDPAVKPGFSGLPTDKYGRCNLSFVTLPDRNPNDVYVSEEKIKIYEKNGWARRLSTLPATFTVTLDTKVIQQSKPKQTKQETDDYTLNITRMIYLQTGGSLALHFDPKPHTPALSESNRQAYDFAVLDERSGKPLRDSGSQIETFQNSGNINFSFNLKPASEGLPKAILIIPGIYSPKRDPSSESYDPNLPKDPYFYDSFESQPEKAWRIELE